jgi:hypothetical protein
LILETKKSGQMAHLSFASQFLKLLPADLAATAIHI